MGKTYLSRFFFFLVIGWWSLLDVEATAYSLRQFSSKNGLSNSAILSICQDCDGLIWIGSCDGLNVFDGTELRLYKPVDVRNNLSGNLIDNIMEAEDHVLWIQTNYGLDRFDTHLQTVQRFKDFQDISCMAKTRENDVLVIKDDGYIYYFDRKGLKFHRLNAKRVAFEDIQYICVDSANVLWIFSSSGDVRSYVIEKKEDSIPELILQSLFEQEGELFWTSGEGDLVYFIDGAYDLYEYDLRSRNKYFIADLKEEIAQRGQVSSIVKQRDDYYVGFKSSGLICLKYQSDSKVKYVMQSIGIESGIFCLFKDRFQDIIWVGTDGQGVYMYFIDHFSIRNTLLDTSDYQINTPVRALFLDDEQTLWVGTKGDGILRMLRYAPDTGGKFDVERLHTGNSSLTDNSVYCFAPSCWNRLWIGTEHGMNYYSYRERKVKEFPVMVDGKTLRYVHSICELNDSTIWVATVGEGIVKIVLNVSDGEPKVMFTRRIVLDGGRRASNYFFTSHQENDSILWFGNRGYGAYRMNVKTEVMMPFRFDQEVSNQAVNDIFAILSNKKGYWLGTSFGLTHMQSPGNYRVYNEADGFPNNTVHGILEDGEHNLWLSTNQGVVRFNIEANTVQAYNRQNNLEVTEFSDGAFFKDERTGTLFFGGTNGFITINENDLTAMEYMPKLQFYRLSIFGKEYNIYHFLRQDKDVEVLELDYSQNFFNLSFVAVDYINGNNYTYSYMIDGLSNNWIENGSSTTAVFSNLPPGQYTLWVKCRSNIMGKESKPYSLVIRIAPPWYMTQLAYWGYFLLFLLLLWGLVYMAIRRYRRKRDIIIEKLNRQKRDEIYESKLRFFTNITHEFCTPLTLISGPCEKILSYAGTDGYIRKYADLVQQNAQKLNSLIQELIEFRRLETGHKVLDIQEVAVDEHTRGIAESFGEWVESRKVDYQLNIEEGDRWNTDVSCLSKIVNNLISNAFKYTSDGGKITVEQCIEGERLCIRVSNSGKGIKKENLDKIFDRYKILDDFETQNKNEAFPRNGLGLAICHSMVNLLAGEIRVMSIPEEVTTFEVVLPMLTVTDAKSGELKELKKQVMPISDKPVEQKKDIVADYDASRQTIMIIDDDPSMLWFVTEIFAGKYNVQPFNSAQEALEQLKLKQPDLILSDVMMPDMDGRAFAKIVKEDKLLSHIPLVLLSALNYIDEQVKGIESGAEAYVTKPFNVEYLEKIVERQIRRKEDMKEYYSSIYSAFKLEDGHLLHKEDKSFFEKMMRVIDEYVENPELSVELLSASLGCSTRQFYRKLKNVTDKTPADIIKEYRLTVAERLLLTTNLTVEEIMNKAGYTNRGTFYKVFSQKFGMPPRQYREMKKKDLKEKDFH